jgi:hypothetical protein
MPLNLPTTVSEILKENPNKKMTARNIAEEIFRQKPDDCKHKKEASNFESDERLITQIIAEIASMKHLILKKDSKIRTIEERPRKFIFDTETIKTLNNENPELDENEDSAEKDLYPKLCSYLWYTQSIYPKRIDEKRSGKQKGRKGNMWLHPDIVGFEFNASEYNEVVLDLLNKIDVNEKFSISSYEVKLSLSRSNIRESFIQAATNSSWANYGFLVAAEINEDIISECKILANQFGIGLIRIDVNEPTENSEVVIQAKKNNLNWMSINRLFIENTDFQEFIQTINDSLKLNKIIEKGWDIPKV